MGNSERLFYKLLRTEFYLRDVGFGMNNKSALKYATYLLRLLQFFEKLLIHSGNMVSRDLTRLIIAGHQRPGDSGGRNKYLVHAFMANCECMEITSRTRGDPPKRIF